ncbi:MAG: PDDEXK nuclease domain-containing protein [Simkaniaceae bacterium]|nr:PDDEXK nuclease domain-containing protein [Simkaniaceae bacterium]
MYLHKISAPFSFFSSFTCSGGLRCACKAYRIFGRKCRCRDSAKDRLRGTFDGPAIRNRVGHRFRSPQPRRLLAGVGPTMSFVGSQYRIEVEGQEFFIDLLFHRRKLRSLVAVELKVSNFKSEYVGKMQCYLAVSDDTVRLKDENPSIGVIICKSKKQDRCRICTEGDE